MASIDIEACDRQNFDLVVLYINFISDPVHRLIRQMYNFIVHTVYSNPPEVIKGNTELLESDSVTLTLEWTQEAVTLLSYTVRVTPFREAAIVRSDGNSSVQLTLPYNTQFNVSVVTTLCGHTLSETTVELEYSKIWHHKFNIQLLQIKFCHLLSRCTCNFPIYTYIHMQIPVTIHYYKKM